MAFGQQAARQSHQPQMSEDAERVAEVVGQFERLKADNIRLQTRLTESDKMVAVRDGEIAAQTREIASLRYRLTFYQNVAARLSASYNDVIAVMTNALDAAQQAAQEQADVEQMHGSAELPPIEIPPLFIQRMRNDGVA